MASLLFGAVPPKEKVFGIKEVYRPADTEPDVE
jgi:hypothetical protein